MLLYISSFLPSVAQPTRLDVSDIGQQLNLPIYEWYDPDVQQKGIIVAAHGLTFYASAYDDLAKFFASQGFKFYAGDMRGFGRWKTEYAQYNGDDLIHFTLSQEDLLRTVDAVRRANPDAKIYCLGESLGANLVFWVASSHPKLIDGVIATSPCYKRCIHPRWRWSEDVIKGLSNPKKQMNLEPYINPYLSDDRTLTLACLKDSLICRDMSPVDLVKTSITNKETLKYVKEIPAEFPILIIAGEKDMVFQTKTIPQFVSQIGSQHVSLKILPSKGHLLLEHQPVNPVVGNLIDDWLATQSTKPKEELVKANE